MNNQLLEVTLPHYESIGKFIFALVTETGKTLATGSGDKMRAGIAEHGHQKLYIYCQH